MPHRGIFLTVGFKSLRILSRPKKRHPVGCPFLACPKGFEPPFSGIGIRCVIQLRHGQMYAAGYFACRFSFLICIILSENQLQKLLCSSFQITLCGYYTTIFYFKQGKFVAHPDCKAIIQPYFRVLPRFRTAPPAAFANPRDVLKAP